MTGENDTSKAARAMGRRSAQARREALGEKKFLEHMQLIGKRGGRPRKNSSTEPNLGASPKSLNADRSKTKGTVSRKGRS